MRQRSIIIADSTMSNSRMKKPGDKIQESTHMDRTISDGKITVSNSEYVASNTNKNNPWAKF